MHQVTQTLEKDGMNQPEMNPIITLDIGDDGAILGMKIKNPKTGEEKKVSGGEVLSKLTEMGYGSMARTLKAAERHLMGKVAKIKRKEGRKENESNDEGFEKEYETHAGDHFKRAMETAVSQMVKFNQKMMVENVMMDVTFDESPNGVSSMRTVLENGDYLYMALSPSGQVSMRIKDKDGERDLQGSLSERDEIALRQFKTLQVFEQLLKSVEENLRMETDPLVIAKIKDRETFVKNLNEAFVAQAMAVDLVPINEPIEKKKIESSNPFIASMEKKIGWDEMERSKESPSAKPKNVAP